MMSALIPVPTGMPVKLEKWVPDGFYFFRDEVGTVLFPREALLQPERVAEVVMSQFTWDSLRHGLASSEPEG